MLHIELRKWADLLIIAPLSANSLAKAAQGLCDNCLTSVVRAWDFSKPLLVSMLLPSLLTGCDRFRSGDNILSAGVSFASKISSKQAVRQHLKLLA